MTDYFPTFENEEEWEPKENNLWRGEEHLEDWPYESFLNAEYGLFKKDVEKDEEDDGN